MDFIINYCVDAVLIILLLTNVFDSARKGFFRCVLSLVCVVIAAVAAITFAQPAAEWSYDNILHSTIQSELEDKLDEGIDSQAAAATVTQAIGMIPEFLSAQLADMGIDVGAVSKKIDSLELSPEDTAEKISKEIIRPGALVLLKLVLYILIFILVRFVLGCIVGIIDKLPLPSLLRNANKWLGAALGTAKGVIIVLVICFAANALTAFFEEESLVNSAVSQSRICSLVSELGQPDFEEIKKVLK